MKLTKFQWIVIGIFVIFCGITETIYARSLKKKLDT